ncbi:MAG: hypothetical protein ABUK01_18845 [Leptospirales bacterium]
MEANTVTLLIGLGGIIATLISSALGLYFTSKARSSTLREMLYSKQTDLIVSIMSIAGRIRVFTTILTDENSQHKIRAREDLGQCVKNLSEFAEKGAAILPTELWVEVKKLSDQTTSIAVEYDESETIKQEEIFRLISIDTKTALLARSVLGVDELTEESLKIFSSKKSFERLANIEASTFEDVLKRNAKQ